MEPDKYQQAWQAHSSQTRVAVDADSLLEVVRRSQRGFRATILWRDITEVGVGLLLLPFWIYVGLTGSQPWTWWLGVPAIIFVIGFFLVDRWRHPQTPSDPGEPLLKCVQNSLAQVEHQIWLLRNIFWWYLLPFTIAILAYIGHVSWLKSRDWLDALSDVNALIFVFLFGMFYFIYYLNQRAVRTQLEPQRQELLTLLANLGDETTSEVSGEYPILMSANRFECSPRRLFVVALCFFAILLIAMAGLLIAPSLIETSLD